VIGSAVAQRHLREDEVDVTDARKCCGLSPR
jgi:hypothetical protein